MRTRLERLGLRGDDKMTIRLLRLRRDAAAWRPRWRYEQPPQTIRELLTDAELRHEGHEETPIYRELYRTTCTPDAEWQRGKLEALRYKWRYRHVTHVMQTLADNWPNVLAAALWAYAVLIVWIHVRWMLR